MNRDDPQYESDCYQRLASARRLLMRALVSSGRGTASAAAGRLLERRVTEYANVVDAANAKLTTGAP